MQNLRLHYNIAIREKPERIDTIVVSTQHDDFDNEKEMLEKINEDVKTILIPRVKRLLPAKGKNYLKMILNTL